MRIWTWIPRVRIQSLTRAPLKVYFTYLQIYLDSSNTFMKGWGSDLFILFYINFSATGLRIRVLYRGGSGSRRVIRVEKILSDPDKKDKWTFLAAAGCGKPGECLASSRQERVRWTVYSSLHLFRILQGREFVNRSRIHERTSSLRFLDIILRFLTS